MSTHHQKIQAELASNEIKFVDLADYGTPGVGVFASRSSGKALRALCHIKDGDRVALVVPEYVYALCAGFPDELLRNTLIVYISEHIKADVLETLTRRHVPHDYREEELPGI